MKRYLIRAAILILTAAPVFAGHANPWAGDDDTVQSKNHDANQSKSIDTPGEDEMRGRMEQTARGKLDAVGRDADRAGGD